MTTGIILVCNVHGMIFYPSCSIQGMWSYVMLPSYLFHAGTRAELMRSASGVGLGRGGKGKKKGTSKTALRKFRPFKFGEGLRNMDVMYFCCVLLFVWFCGFGCDVCLL